MAARIADAERRRYALLEEQRAIHGYDTPPHVLMELNELRSKYGPIELLDQPHVQERRHKLELDIEFWGTVTSAALRRITAMEQAVKLGRVMDIVIGLLLCVLLVLAFMGRL